MSISLVEYLNRFSEADWLAAIEELLPEIHEVDRNAVQIWFRFYPLELKRYMDAAENRDEPIKGLALLGNADLASQIDTSHHFLYGHRFWPTVKRKILKSEPPAVAGGLSPAGTGDRSATGPKLQPPATAGGSDQASLVDTIKAVACEAARKLGVERPLVNAIAAVGLMTLNQVGLEAFTAASGEIEQPKGLMAKSPERIVEERGKDDSQGVFGFLKTVDKKFSVSFAGIDHRGKFPIIAEEEIASASQKDRTQDWQARDERCWEGPVPIECTSASCGTCWVGVLGGQEKLSPVQRRERRQMKVFGYNQPEGEQPFLRLACQARATGNVTVVIPPWNGVFGKKVYGNVEEVELEPVTTSAKALRETIASAVTEK